MQKKSAPVLARTLFSVNQNDSNGSIRSKSPINRRMHKIPYNIKSEPKIIPRIAKTMPFSSVALICLAAKIDITKADVPTTSENIPRGKISGTSERTKPTIAHTLYLRASVFT